MREEEKNEIPLLLNSYEELLGYINSEMEGDINLLYNKESCLDLYQGFTQNRRVNYDIKSTLPANRLDLIYALRIGWVTHCVWR
jgi:hypothetical protein